MNRRLAMLGLALVLLAACGDGVEAERCAVLEGDAVNVDLSDEPCLRLSSYRLFVGDQGRQVANLGVVPYQLNTPLFSDYTRKDRWLWLPPGTSMSYHNDAAFAAPLGSVAVKTFSYPADRREPYGPRRLLETRLMIHHEDGWRGHAYLWNAEQTDASRVVAGASLAASWIHDDGRLRSVDYLVPNANQCKQCHEEQADAMSLLGPKARHLNLSRVYTDDEAAGPVNQLVYLSSIGYLSGAPADPETQAPRAPDASDESSGTVEARARAWLEINCAHCHNPGGAARTSGLDLRAAQSNPYEYGVCKTPVAAGAGSGDRFYNIVPGAPDDSILVLRIESVEPAVMMPELGRSTVHAEGVALVRAWIERLPGGGCDSAVGEGLSFFELPGDAQ